MNEQKQADSSEVTIARAVQDACIQAAKEGFRDASISGLCTEGAIEAAVSAIQLMDIEKVVVEAKKGDE